MAAVPNPVDDTGAEKGSLVLRDVVKTYVMGTQELHALRGVSLDLFPGDFLSIMGPSGSGKSTLVTDVLYAALARAGSFSTMNGVWQIRFNGVDAPIRTAPLSWRI